MRRLPAKSAVGMGELRGGNRKSDGWESLNASPASKMSVYLQMSSGKIIID